MTDDDLERLRRGLAELGISARLPRRGARGGRVSPREAPEPVTGDLEPSTEGYTVEDARAYIASQRWVYAKTMPRNPHEYVVLRKSTDPEGHLRFRAFIRRTGRAEQFRRSRWVFVYLDIDGWSYWVTQTDPAPDGDVWTIINRRTA